MAYLGNAPVVGDSTNSFRLLDDIASFTVTFDATDTSIVSISGDTLSFTNHRFVTGQKVTYTDGGGTAIGGLTDGTSYFIIKVDQNTIKLATNASNAASSTAINLTSGAAGGSHTLKVAFDGVNTKFKATFNNGKKAKISRAGQISLSINGVIQQPQDSSSPSVGYGVEADSTIVFSTAPVATDKVFATFIGEVAASFDIEDNTIDNFTGDGSTTIFNLSKEVPSSQDVLVTLDGVTQHPSDGSTTRSYSVINQALTFVSAPDTGVAIQARHIGFAGATTSAVTGFYGRTGNAALTSTDDISVQNISGVGATFTGNVNIDLAGTGSVVVSALETDGSFTLSAYLGNDGSSEEAMSATTISASGITITLAGGSGQIAASVLSSSALFTLTMTNSIESDTSSNITSLSASGMQITLGLGDDLLVSTMGIYAAGVIDLAASSDFTNTAYTGGSTNTLTVNHVGGGEVNFSSLTVGNGFTYNGTGVTTGASSSAVTINTDQTGGVVFNYGDGGFGFISASTVNTLGGFEINGGSLTTAEMAFTSISASAAVVINMGSAGGELQISAINTSSTITINAGSTSTLNFDVGAAMSASGSISITLGSQSAAADATRISSIATDTTFTLNGGAYRERFDVNDISASAATITFGDLSDGFSASAVNVTSLAFNGGTGANFSATIQDLDISSGSGWTITMPELGNGLTINQLSYAKSGTIRGTTDVDTISADSASASGEEITVEFYLGEESTAKADVAKFMVGGGADIVKLHNFVNNSDGLTTEGTSASTTNYNNLTTVQAISILGDALNTTVSTGDTTYNAGSAVFTYNGSSWLIIDSTAAGGTTLGDGDILFQFVGVTNVDDGDVTFV